MTTLQAWERSGNQFAFKWESEGQNDQFIGISKFEVVDAQGQSHAPLRSFQSESDYFDSERNVQVRSFQSAYPEGIDPVAVRATQVGVKVTGPWVFELAR